MFAFRLSIKAHSAAADVWSLRLGKCTVCCCNNAWWHCEFDHIIVVQSSSLAAGWSARIMFWRHGLDLSHAMQNALSSSRAVVCSEELDLDLKRIGQHTHFQTKYFLAPSADQRFGLRSYRLCCPCSFQQQPISGSKAGTLCTR